ncbi:hypothetical protein MRB53_039661 [Persea americana]|nr:hypothetical protein MRB53_039661 [Persea americana]
MNLQVLSALGISKAFVLGTSQGGWITVRMALLGPDVVEGIIPLGTSLDFESERTRKLGCWNGPADLAPSIQKWTMHPQQTAADTFVPGEDYSNFLIDIGFGKDCDQQTRQFWNNTIKENYRGDGGRRRIREAAVNLAERDGLHSRLSNVTCPVLWLHGTKDPVYTVANAEEEIKLFTNAKDKKLQVVEDGQHFLSFSHPKCTFSPHCRKARTTTKFHSGTHAGEARLRSRHKASKFCHSISLPKQLSLRDKRDLRDNHNNKNVCAFDSIDALEDLD